MPFQRHKWPESECINHLMHSISETRMHSKLCFFVKQTHYQCQCALNSLSPPAQQTECSSNRHYCRQLSGFQHLLPAVLQLKKMDHNKHKCECVCVYVCSDTAVKKKKIFRQWCYRLMAVGWLGSVWQLFHHLLVNGWWWAQRLLLEGVWLVLW